MTGLTWSNRMRSACAVADSWVASAPVVSLVLLPPQPDNATAATASQRAITARFDCNFIQGFQSQIKAAAAAVKQRKARVGGGAEQRHAISARAELRAQVAGEYLPPALPSFERGKTGPTTEFLVCRRLTVMRTRPRNATCCVLHRALRRAHASIVARRCDSPKTSRGGPRFCRLAGRRLCLLRGSLGKSIGDDFRRLTPAHETGDVFPWPARHSLGTRADRPCGFVAARRSATLDNVGRACEMPHAFGAERRATLHSRDAAAGPTV
jgi:hypothetical protein